MVRADPNVAGVSHRCVSSRVLVVHLCIASKPCRIVCAHAPIAEADRADHSLFAHDIELALAGTKPGELVSVGVDLNARLGDLAD
eukprot:3797628-Amphidinium_carterae.1